MLNLVETPFSNKNRIIDYGNLTRAKCVIFERNSNQQHNYPTSNGYISLISNSNHVKFVSILK